MHSSSSIASARRRVATDSSSALVTRRDDGSWALAVWNLEQPEERGTSKEITITMKGWRGSRRARISRLDAAHGSVLPAYEAMGRPVSPTPDQLRALRRAADLGPDETKSFERGRLVLTVPAHGMALLEVR